MRGGTLRQRNRELIEELQHRAARETEIRRVFQRYVPETVIDEALETPTAELFKLRNARNAVVGVASRVAARDELVGDVIEWVLHLPSRGSMYVSLKPESIGEGRAGDIRGGTREFAGMVGQMSERWIGDESPQAEAGAGRIQLVASFVSRDSGRIEGAVE